MNKHDVGRAVRAFQIPGKFDSAAPYGSGHINDTYAAVFQHNGACVRYIVQRINHNIFKDVPALMQNVDRVCSYMRKKLEQTGASDIDRRTLTLIPTSDGKPYHRDEDGNYWRVYIFVEGATGYDIAKTENDVYEAARAFGEFQLFLADMPGGRLNETIPGFHDTPTRYKVFESVLKEDKLNRAVECKNEIDFALKRKAFAGTLLDLYHRGLLPERVTHNDTKLNNVLIDDKTGKAVCVIDLDTLMPGLSLYDFGDLVRTSTNSAAEDERDITKVTMRMPIYKAVVRGFLDSAGYILTKAEKENLHIGGIMMILECGVRFLADYLQGDVYFKTHRPGHNLDRCRTQFKLAESMEQQFGMV